MTSDRDKRRIVNLLIDFRVQHRVVVINLLFMFLVFILTVAIIYTHLSEMETGATGLWNIPFGDLNIVITFKLVILYVLLLVTFILSVISQLRMTHRVCGPLVNFCSAYKKIACGDFLKRVYLRRDDLLHEEANQFNEMVTRVSEMVNELKTENDKLSAAVEDATRGK
ncbi:MAG: methyl-accepting chemotaxis protein [Deltaproteobacteria bacterium]|nr:methyl-accepting chemotaxis protein [Deltaproteobacteria bacterium]